MSRKSGLWITPREISRADTVFGIPFKVLRQDGERYWIYQAKLDITFAVDEGYLIDFGKGEVVSDDLFAAPSSSITPSGVIEDRNETGN